MLFRKQHPASTSQSAEGTTSNADVVGATLPLEGARPPASEKGSSDAPLVVTRSLQLLALLVFCAVFARGLDNWFVSDDWGFLGGVASAKDFRAIVGLLEFDTQWFVRPTQWLTTLLLYRVAGLNAVWYHATCIALHLGNGLLAYVLWKKVLSRELAGRWVALAATGAACLFVFSHHHHEAVFWYASINEPLSASFRLQTLVLLWNAFDRDDRPSFQLVLAATATSVLALLSKESAVVLPAEIALMLAFEHVTRPSGRAARLIHKGATVAGLGTLTAVWLAAYTLSAQESAEGLRNGMTVLSASPIEWLFRFEHALARCYVDTKLPGSEIVLSLAPVAVMVVLMAAVLRRRYSVPLSALWMLVGVAPFVAMATAYDNAQAVPPLLREVGINVGRYYYYPTLAAGGLLVALAAWVAAEAGVVAGRYAEAGAAVVCTVALALYGVRDVQSLLDNERGWDRAGAAAKRIVRTTLEALPSVSTGAVLCLSNIPDNYNGKFIFRNGLREALHLAYASEDFGVAVNERRHPRTCTWSLVWNEVTGRMERR